jgi:hypothetical protein
MKNSGIGVIPEFLPVILLLMKKDFAGVEIDFPMRISFAFPMVFATGIVPPFLEF